MSVKNIYLAVPAVTIATILLQGCSSNAAPASLSSCPKVLDISIQVSSTLSKHMNYELSNQEASDLLVGYAQELRDATSTESNSGLKDAVSSYAAAVQDEGSSFVVKPTFELDNIAFMESALADINTYCQ